MRRDNKEFRERFQRWKAGEQVYDAGRAIPKYEGGKDGIYDIMKLAVSAVDPNEAEAMRLVGYKNHELALYNTIDPTGTVPNGYAEAAGKYLYAKAKELIGNTNREYELGETLSDSVSDAAWRKRLCLGYYPKFLPTYNGDTVRLPKKLEMEIPTDTNLLKSRIEQNEKLMNNDPWYAKNKIVRDAYNADKQALEGLRETYRTGKAVTINERAYNSRNWVKNGELSPEIQPLNVLQNYQIWYDKNTNTMHYDDTYDFNQYDWAVPGQPYKIHGTIKLPKIK